LPAEGRERRFNMTAKNLSALLLIFLIIVFLLPGGYAGAQQNKPAKTEAEIVSIEGDTEKEDKGTVTTPDTKAAESPLTQKKRTQKIEAQDFSIQNESFKISAYAEKVIFQINPRLIMEGCNNMIEIIASDSANESTTKAAIHGEDGKLELTITLRPEDIGIISPSKGNDVKEKDMLLWCNGATHKWIGKFIYSGYTFDSDKENPLQFRVDKDKGYVYVGGRGTVTTPDGMVVKLPLAKSKVESDVIKTEIKLTKNPDFGRVPGARKFRMEVLKGSIKEKSGAVFKEGSSLSINEDEIIYETGMTIIAGKGGIELKGKFYPEGTKIKVGGKGELIRVKKEKK
jgi:hypothetical protein